MPGTGAKAGFFGATARNPVVPGGKEHGMGTILQFALPGGPTSADTARGPAEIIIFPGVRIERDDDGPQTPEMHSKAAVRMRKQPRKRR